MKVCIIIPPSYGLFDQRSNVPLGPLYIASEFENLSVGVELVSLLGREVPAKFPEADLYAMGFTTPQFGTCAGLLRLIRGQYPGAKVVAAGAHPTFRPYETLAAGFDSVILGEAEIAILQLLDTENIPKVIRSPCVDDLDTIHFPARHLLPEGDLRNRAGSMFLGEHKDAYVTSIIGSRGCPNHCAFCGNSPQGSLRHRSAKNIVDEIVQCLDMGISVFKFQDDSFTIRKDRVIELGNECNRRLGNDAIIARMHTRVNIFSEDIIPALHDINVKVVGFGIESGSQAILDLSRKGTKIEQAESALRLAHDAGFKTLGLFMFGLPGECERTVSETIEFCRRNREYLDMAVMTIFVPYPGSDIAEHPKKYRMHILNTNYDSYWIVQKRTVLALPHEVSFDEMIKLKDVILDAFFELGYSKAEWKHDGAGALFNE